MELSDMSGRDVYMRTTTADGKTYVTSHRCWDADLFETARSAEASKQALEPLAKGLPPGKNKAVRITEDQFIAERHAQ